MGRCACSSFAQGADGFFYVMRAEDERLDGIAEEILREHYSEYWHIGGRRIEPSEFSMDIFEEEKKKGTRRLKMLISPRASTENKSRETLLKRKNIKKKKKLVVVAHWMRTRPFVVF